MTDFVLLLIFSHNLFSVSLNNGRKFMCIGMKNLTLLPGIYFESLLLNTIFNR